MWQLRFKRYTVLILTPIVNSKWWNSIIILQYEYIDSIGLDIKATIDPQQWMYVNKLPRYTLINIGFELTMISTVLITVAVLTVRDQRQANSVDGDLLVTRMLLVVTS